MSLTFAATSTNRVVIPAAASINSLQQITILSWLYPTGFASNQFIATKRSDVNAGWGHRIDDSSGNVYMNKPTAAAGSSAITNDSPLTVNAWNFVAGTGSNDVSSNNCCIYTGNLTTLAVERSYGTRVDRAAATAFDDSAWSLYLGGRHNASQSFAGRLGIQAMFNRVLSLEEIQAWQFAPRVLAGCVGFYLLGDNGTGTVPDYSGNGNAGSVTGATQSDNPPLRRRWWRRSLPLPYVVVSTGISVSPTGVASTAALGTPVVAMAATATPTGISSAAALGTPVPSFGLGVSPSGVASTAALGTPVVTMGLSAAPAGVSSAAAVGTPVVTMGAGIAPTGLSSAAALGTPGVSFGGAFTASPTGVASTAALGTPSVAFGLAVTPAGVSSTATLGTVVVAMGLGVAPTGVASTAALGTPAVAFGGNLSASPSGVSSTAALGTPVVSFSWAALPTGVSATAALGAPVVTMGMVVAIVGVASTAFLGTPVATFGISPSKIYRAVIRGGYTLEAVIRGGHAIGATVRGGHALDATIRGED